MKQSTLRSSIWVFLTIVSLSSYVYLRSVDIPEVNSYIVQNESSFMNEEEEEKAKVVLPDIALVKKLLAVSKFIFLARPVD